MAYRTTESLVAGIIEVDDTLVAGFEDNFIAPANALVTEICVPAGYTNIRLELIERWLSAHNYAIRDPRVDFEKVGPIANRYQSKVALALNVTHYGQNAMLLDTAGGLAKLSREVSAPAKPMFSTKPSIHWGGTPHRHSCNDIVDSDDGNLPDTD